MSPPSRRAPSSGSKIVDGVNTTTQWLFCIELAHYRRLGLNMRIVILTGDETRHRYFRVKMASDERIKVLASFCEGVEESLENRVARNEFSSALEKLHVDARTQAEEDFFGVAISAIRDESNPRKIAKGEINNDSVVSEIENLNAEVLVCYGSSLIKSTLLKSHKGRFLNVHLGLSPYYRGSGTNVWPLINREPDMVGATFMYIDEGIDTGEIIHQIRADIFLGDSPHSIGNRLIRKMTDTYCEIVAKYRDLSTEPQPKAEGKLYLQKHFDRQACDRLYQNFRENMIQEFIETRDETALPYIVQNKAISH
jgi:phosphoribosylglycinamide formyltransferase-1